MYSFEEKEKIMNMLKKGITIDIISREQGIPESILLEWQKELEIRQRIKLLINQNKLKEAEEEIDTLSGPINEMIRLSFHIIIARKQEDRDKEKELLQEQLSINPKDMIAMSGMINIARAENDRDTETYWLKRQLEVNPRDMIAMSGMINIARAKNDRAAEKYWLQRQRQVEKDNAVVMSGLIRVARAEGDINEEKNLTQSILKISPKNIPAISNAIKIAKKEGDIETEKALLELILSLEPNNIKAMNSRARIARVEQDLDTERQYLERILELEPDDERANNSLKYINRIAPVREKTTTESMEQVLENLESDKLSPIRKSRQLIYESENSIQAGEGIKELLGDEETLERELVLAELYFNAGLPSRAKNELKRYISTLQETKDIRIVKKALQLLQSGKTRKHDWEGLWFEIYENQQKESNKKATVFGENPAGEER